MAKIVKFPVKPTKYVVHLEMDVHVALHIEAFDEEEAKKLALNKLDSIPDFWVNYLFDIEIRKRMKCT